MSNINKNNELRLKVGNWGRVIHLNEGIHIFLPVMRKLANARVVEVGEDGSLKVHWDSNYNLNGDFRSELMKFNSNLILDEKDKESRNKFRRQHGLVEIG